jgi:hypothetical protein
VNVFESARFYYGLLWLLIGYSIVREVIQKFTLVYHTEPYIFPREIVGVLFFIFITFSIISAWFLRKKIDKNIFIFVATISIISLINEIRYALETNEYNLNDSLTTGQLYYVAKIIFPLLFLGFWSLLDNEKIRTAFMIRSIESLFLLNAGLIFFGGILADIPLMESYPLSGRWGYCGLLLDRVTTQLAYGLLLLHNWSPNKPFYWKNLVFIICLLVSGQKAGFLWLGLFIVFVVIRSGVLRTAIVLLAAAIFAFIIYYIKALIGLSPFWEKVYLEHGIYGSVFSLRNELLRSVFESEKEITTITELFFGGISRYPTRIEFLPLDLFIYFGFVGLVFFIWFLTNWIYPWKWSIPLVVACFAGGVMGSALAVVFFGLFMINEEKS